MRLSETGFCSVRPRPHRIAVAATLALGCLATAASAQVRGVYRQPALHGDTLLFAAEGDLWTVAAAGGAARRLTTDPGEETFPRISPDGTHVAFCGQYEGPVEVYIMPIEGGRARRLTFGAERPQVVGFRRDGHVLVATSALSTLPGVQLLAIDPASGAIDRIPLAQAAEGVFDDEGRLYFTRQRFQGSQTKRYRGGTARSLWRFDGDGREAVHLTADFAGECFSPMWHRGRVYFLGDFDGTVNLWSMRPDGGDRRQHTRFQGLDVRGATLDRGRVVLQWGVDLHVHEIAAGETKALDIRLASDLTHRMDRWIEKPLEWVTSAHLSPDGERVVLTIRGDVVVAPRKQGRTVEVTRDSRARFRQAQFLPGTDRLLALSDETGELELWSLPADGLGPRTQVTRDGAIFRFDPAISPDGRSVAWQDKDMRLWMADVGTGEPRLVAQSVSQWDPFSGLVFSPDSRWLAFVETVANTFTVIRIHAVESGETHTITSDRVNSRSPAWSPDGTWLWFLSDRHFQSSVASVWGAYQPEPAFVNQTKVYGIPLAGPARSPFEPADEFNPPKKPGAKSPDGRDAPAVAGTPPGTDAPAPAADAPPADVPRRVEIDFTDIAARLHEAPLPPGNITDLAAGREALFLLRRANEPDAKPALVALPVRNEEIEPVILAADVAAFELSGDRTRLLIRREKSMHIADAGLTPPDLAKTEVPIAGWRPSIEPAEEWRQMFVEAWRLMRDYFYDPGMHGVDWPAMRAKYEPWIERVQTRAELDEVLSQMVGELSALHIYVGSGDYRRGPTQVGPSFLGARLVPAEGGAGLRVDHVYRADPEFPDRRSPLARPGVDVREGDLITQVNGRPMTGLIALGEALRDRAGRQVRLRVRRGVEERDVIVHPVPGPADADLRYYDWEWTRRAIVEESGAGAIGYVHLRAMGTEDFLRFAEQFYPVFNRQGLIVDVRQNRGGNIDSWVLGRLMRRAWMYWQGRVGQPEWNQQYAFRGHIVVLCDEGTASDGEAFCDGFRRLGLGTTIGTRTWGGEIWLSMQNRLVDRGIASAAEFGVYGPEGEWLIEGHGFEPDIEVDNLPHATFRGEDAQLVAAIDHLRRRIEADPRPVPAPPAFPDKSSPDNPR